MKRLLPALGIIAVTLAGFAGSAAAQVSVTIGEPGFYGRITLGDAPRPRVIYDEPVVIERGHAYGPPVYLRVPPGHARHWDQHCREYNACGEPVYFVDDDWYNREYAPYYREHHPEGRREEFREEHRDERRDEYREDRRDDRAPPGRGHGWGREDR